jgi:2,4-dienoyl-CoA reductase-like NADH-dependent reductase (Old Yellow Enzyme family)
MTGYEGGNTPDDAAIFAQMFKEAGADMIDCSSGQVVKEEKPVYGRLFQTPFSDKIRNEIGVPTIAVGAISEADHANSIIAAGRADLCAVARPHLADPSFVLHEAASIGYAGQSGRSSISRHATSTRRISRVLQPPRWTSRDNPPRAGDRQRQRHRPRHRGRAG